MPVDTNQAIIDALFKVGAHYGYVRSRRHATQKKFIFGTKNQVDILDLTLTAPILADALAYVRALGAANKVVLFVGGKPEIADIVRRTATELGQPYVAGRWLGGTVSNFTEIKKRIQRMKDLVDERERGVLAQKYTKKERLLLDREIIRLEENFSGIQNLEKMPDAFVIVDTKRENNAVLEARGLGIPIVGIANSDCDISLISHPIVANDASRDSVSYILGEIASAYAEGRSGRTEVV